MKQFKKNIRKFFKNAKDAKTNNKIIEEDRHNLENEIRLVKDTMHEIRKINNQIKSSSYQLLDILKNYTQDKATTIENIRLNIEANSNLLSIRMDAFDMLHNPESINLSLLKYTKVYAKIEKVYKCLYSKRIERGLEIKLEGKSQRKYKLNDTIELGFFIILENALKYTYNGEIVVNFEEKGDLLEVEFTNYGVCPAINEIEHLRERGYRSQSVKEDSSYEGSGLGLYLLDQICQSNNVGMEIDVKDDRTSFNRQELATFSVKLLFSGDYQIEVTPKSRTLN